MFKKYHSALMSLFYGIDLLLALSALALANLIHQHFSAVDAPLDYPSVLDRTAYVAVALIWGVSFRVFPLYTSKRATSILGEMTTVAGATAFSWTVFAAWCLISNGRELDQRPVLYFGILVLLMLAGFHIGLRIFLRLLRSKGYNHKRVLIIGAGQAGRAIAGELLRRPWAGFSIVGFLDDDPHLHGTRVLSVPVRGGLDLVRSIVETLDRGDEVVVALPSPDFESLEKVIRAIEDIPVNVRVIPDLFAIASVRPVVEDLWGIPLIGVRQPMILGSAAVFKQVMDTVCAALGLVLLSPLLLTVAILVKRDSKGTVFFVQERVGENGRPFRMYKFRTMVEGAEELLDDLIDIDSLEEPAFKLRDDPRRTRLGQFLRRTGIDELPQLVNVLKGEMSIVGPRPEETRLVQRYSSYHRKRLMAKPGITGPVQVNGRADLSLSERVELELDYLRNYSIGRDVMILVKTALAVIRGDGAY